MTAAMANHLVTTGYLNPGPNVQNPSGSTPSQKCVSSDNILTAEEGVLTGSLQFKIEGIDS